MISLNTFNRFVINIARFAAGVMLGTASTICLSILRVTLKLGVVAVKISIILSLRVQLVTASLKGGLNL